MFMDSFVTGQTYIIKGKQKESILYYLVWKDSARGEEWLNNELGELRYRW